MSKTKWTTEVLEAAHKHSLYNHREILHSCSCGCFYCGAVFTPSALNDDADWTDDYAQERTALCPECMIDSVLGDASGYPVTDEEFLEAMREYWF